MEEGQENPLPHPDPSQTLFSVHKTFGVLQFLYLICINLFLSLKIQRRIFFSPKNEVIKSLYKLRETSSSYFYYCTQYFVENISFSELAFIVVVFYLQVCRLQLSVCFVNLSPSITQKIYNFFKLWWVQLINFPKNKPNFPLIYLFIYQFHMAIHLINVMAGYPFGQVQGLGVRDNVLQRSSFFFWDWF